MLRGDASKSECTTDQDPAEAYFKLTKAEGVDSAKDAQRHRAVTSIPYRP